MTLLTTRRQDPVLVSLGDAIRTIRESKAISQRGLALQAGIDQSYLFRVERGDNNVAVLTLIKIAHALDVTVAELMMIAML
jgi:transcriptional regulator with XRE-family HTH domain